MLNINTFAFLYVFDCRLYDLQCFFFIFPSYFKRVTMRLYPHLSVTANVSIDKFIIRYLNFPEYLNTTAIHVTSVKNFLCTTAVHITSVKKLLCAKVVRIISVKNFLYTTVVYIISVKTSCAPKSFVSPQSKISCTPQ